MKTDKDEYVCGIVRTSIGKVRTTVMNRRRIEFSTHINGRDYGLVLQGQRLHISGEIAWGEHGWEMYGYCLEERERVDRSLRNRLFHEIVAAVSLWFNTLPPGEVGRTDRDYFRHEKRCLGNELSELAEDLSDRADALEESAKENSLAEAQSPLLNMAKALRDTSAIIAEGRKQFKTVRYTSAQMAA